MLWSYVANLMTISVPNILSWLFQFHLLGIVLEIIVLELLLRSERSWRFQSQTCVVMTISVPSISLLLEHCVFTLESNSAAPVHRHSCAGIRSLTSLEIWNYRLGPCRQAASFQYCDLLTNWMLFDRYNWLSLYLTCIFGAWRCVLY